MSDLHFEGTDLIISRDDLSSDLLNALLDCGRPGPADAAVAYVMETYNVTGDPETCADYLRWLGPWSYDDLEDHDMNLSRLVWLTGSFLAEGENAYWSTYS